MAARDLRRGGLYTGAGRYVVGHGKYAVVPGWVGPVVFALGLGGFLAGLVVLSDLAVSDRPTSTTVRRTPSRWR